MENGRAQVAYWFEQLIFISDGQIVEAFQRKVLENKHDPIDDDDDEIAE